MSLDNRGIGRKRRDIPSRLSDVSLSCFRFFADLHHRKRTTALKLLFAKLTYDHHYACHRAYRACLLSPCASTSSASVQTIRILINENAKAESPAG